MDNITFDFLGQHRHGAAFHDYLRLRKTFFVDKLGWDVPHNRDVEMDQYDNPCARYSLVLQGRRVVGGARTMPTSACWGRATYMLRDAMRGGIDGIPADLVPDEIASDAIWECTRLVVSDELGSHEERSVCLSLIVSGLVRLAQQEGGSELISLSPLPLMRALRQLGYAASRFGNTYGSPEDNRVYAVLRMPALRPAEAIAAE